MDIIRVKELGIREALPYLWQKRELESGTPYMPTSERDRKENLLISLLRMYHHRKRILTFLAYEGDDDRKILGYLLLVLGRYAKFRGNAYIANVSVRLELRGKGIGTRLMAEAEKVAKERGARRMELEVFSRNVNAIKLYEKLGYEVEGVKRKAIETKEGFDDLVFMAKFL